MPAGFSQRFLVVAAVFGVAGCGASPVPPAATTSEPTTTTTTTTRPRADAATADLASRATITLTDLGESWMLHAEGREGEPVADDDCAAGTVLADLPTGARWSGGQFKTREARWFVYSASAVFPDEATAVKWVEVRKSATYVECRRAEIERGQRTADPRFSVAVAETTGPGLGTNGFEAYVLYQLKADTDGGARDSNANFARHTYRVGRVVVSLSLDISSATTDPADLTSRVTTDVTRALAAVYERIGKA
ncbi:hypothetical protein SUDANB95_03437 [Actinosynnema sp. ALI-1.44]